MTFKPSVLNRRGFLKSTAAGTIAAALPFGAMAAPKKGGHLRVAMARGSTSDTLNPGILDNSNAGSLAFAVHARLAEVAADGSIVPEAAESWETSSDASEWRVKIRKDVTFHSGKTLDVNDVVNSINFHRGENSTSAAGPIAAEIAEITTEGEDTVIFTLKAGNADFPAVLSDYHMVLCKADGDTIDWQSMDGCGAYRMVNYQPGVNVQLERHPAPWREDVGWFDTAEILTITDQNARTTALVAGDVDMADTVDLKAAGLLGRKPGIKIESVAGNQHYTYAMDTRADPFTDNHVRLALKYGIDRQEMLDKILFGYGALGNDTPIGKGQRFYHSELEQRGYDPDKAKFHLKEAGLDAVDLKLSAADVAYPGAVDAAVLYQNAAAKAGINIKIVREPNDGYWSEVWLKKPFVSVYWSGRATEDIMFTTAYSCGADWNDTHWCHDGFDDLLVKARSELDEDKRRQMYWDMQEIVHNEGGSVVPLFANYVFARHDKLAHGDLASNWDVDGMRFIERWWFA